MARGKKTGGRDFQPGHKYSPKTRLTKADLDFRRLSAKTFSEIIMRYFDKTKAQLEKAMKDENTPASDLIILTILSKGITEGDHHRMEALLTRMLGKVPDKIEHSNPDGTMRPQVVDEKSLTVEQLKTIREVIKANAKDSDSTDS